MSLTRRQFLGAATAAAAFTIVPRHVLGGPKFVAPSEKVNVALVGAGGQGLHNVRQLLQIPECQVMALADPFEETDLFRFYFKCNAGRGPVSKVINDHYQAQKPDYKCAVYEDFRVMMEKEKSIDAILCATPDHLHAYVSICAMKAGKHIYCEKPLTHSIWEARQVAKVTKESGLANQHGNMGHSRDTIRQTVEWLRDGAIGKVSEVHCWNGYKRWNPTLTSKPAETQPIPKGANWDLWIGPREPRPYHLAYAPVTWRDFWAFGGGGLADFACHNMDAAVWALDLGIPTSVQGLPAGVMDAEIAPHGQIVYYNFPAAGERPAVKLTWYDGGLQPPRPAELGPKNAMPDTAIMFVGDKGKMLVETSGGVPRLLPYEATAKYKKPTPTIPRVANHHKDWIDACKGGRPACSDFQYGAKLVELLSLGIISVRTGKVIEWDAETMTAKGVPEAEPMIKETYRKGWELPV